MIMSYDPYYIYYGLDVDETTFASLNTYIPNHENNPLFNTILVE
jgi:hypothetical protein